MKNRIEAGQSYWFHSSWDKKHDRESFIGNDNECKIIISDRIPDFEGKYKIAEVKKLADNYSIVSLGDREKPEDLFSGIGLDDAIDVLKKFGFEVFIRDYDYCTGWDDRNEETHTYEHQLIAWHHKLGIFVNGGTWDSGTHFNNLDIKCPNIFGCVIGRVGGLRFSQSSGNEVTIDVVNSYSHRILSSIINKLQYMKIEKGIEVSHNINGKKTYFDLNNYDMNKNTHDELLVDCDKIYNMLPESGKEFMDNHVFIKND